MQTDNASEKKIIIFSDGTGQYGGVLPDQRLSNIYKMYRGMTPPSIEASQMIDFFQFIREFSLFLFRRVA